MRLVINAIMKRERKKQTKECRDVSDSPVRQKSFSFKTKFLWACVAALATFAVYIPSLDNEVTSWDDTKYINENPYLEELSWKNARHLFKVDTYYMGNYHPLSMLSLSLDYACSGSERKEEVRPFMFHLTNALLHTLVSVLVFFFVLKLFRHLPSAIIVALLFGLHSLHVESVAWISERKDVLYSVFFVASLILYLKYVRQGKVYLYVLSLALFLFSLFSKGQAVSLAVTLLLIDWFESRKLLNARIIIEKIPFFALALIFGLIAVNAQKASEALIEERAYTFIQRIGFASFAFMQYIGKLCLPVKLSAIYPYPDIIGQTVPTFYYLMIIPSVVIAALSVFFVVKNRKNTAFGIVFFIINIVLLLQFIPVGGAVYSDRYSYIPSIGFFILIALLIRNLIEKHPGLKSVFYGIFSIYLVLLSVLTVKRIEIWKDSLTLWEDTVKKSPKAVVAWNNLGSERDKAAEQAKKKLDFALSEKMRMTAIRNFTTAIKLKPDYKSAFYNRGVSRFELSELNPKFKALVDSAISDFNMVLKIDPIYADAYQNRANAKAKRLEMESALKDYNLAIGLKPDDGNFYANRGILFGKTNQAEKAIADFDKAILLNPEEEAYYANRGRAKMMQKRVKEAIKDYDTAIQLNPKATTAFLNRALAWQSLGEKEKALQDFNTLIGMLPSMADAYFYRALLLLEMERPEEACQDFKQAENLGIKEAAAYIRQYCGS